MTRYEVGFMSKCAEYGLDSGTAMRLMKAAKTDSDYAGPAGAIGATAGGLLGSPLAVEGFRPSSLEGLAEEVSGLRNLTGDRLVEWGKGHRLQAMLNDEAWGKVLKGKGELLSDPKWVRQARRQIRGENIAEIAKASGKVGAFAAMLGIPAYALTKIIQNLSRRKRNG